MKLLQYNDPNQDHLQIGDSIKQEEKTKYSVMEKNELKENLKSKNRHFKKVISHMRTTLYNISVLLASSN